MTAKTVRVLIEGRVQGVGFRYWVYGRAVGLGLDGWVRNLPDGRVEATFAGAENAVAEMLAACWQGPRFCQVKSVVEEACAVPPPAGFEIRR
ncbi:MAG TPA: acylphosphatase [Kiloniellaceae bacterium]|nr:acylphosphatase [Kiloniellaceae bacterium]